MITSNSNFVVDQMILVFSIDAFYEHEKEGVVKRKHDDEYLHKDYGFFFVFHSGRYTKKEATFNERKKEKDCMIRHGTMKSNSIFILQ
jgi:hypothetical protein